MTPTLSWDPFRETLGTTDALGRLLDTLWGVEGRRSWLPPVDIYDGKEDVTLIADLPGLKPDQVQVELDENVLTIRGERRADREPEAGRYYRVERPTGSFERSIALPQGLLSDRIEASFEDGTLRVRIPKAEEVKPRRIEIKNKATAQTIEAKAAS